MQHLPVILRPWGFDRRAEHLVAHEVSRGPGASPIAVI